MTAHYGLTTTLADVNGFMLSSLAANQRGELTREQLPVLYRALISPLIFTFVPGAILIYQLGRTGILRGASTAEILTNLRAGLSTPLLILGGILVLISIWGMVLVVKTVMDIAGGEVVSVEDVACFMVVAVGFLGLLCCFILVTGNKRFFGVACYRLLVIC